MRFMSKPKAVLLAVLIVGTSTPATTLASDLSPYGTTTLVFGVPVVGSPRAAGAPSVWQVDFGVQPPAPSSEPSVALDLRAGTAAGTPDEQTPVRRPVAYTYSEGYEVRAKVHKYASFLTLPLFGAQAALGLKLEGDNASETVRASHAAIATTMVGLFTVNTVTGVWNLIEGRSNPSGRGRRLIHGLLMLASDAGFVATGLLAPTNDGGGNRSLHKSVAISSIVAATTGYLIMFFGQ